MRFSTLTLVALSAITVSATFSQVGGKPGTVPSVDCGDEPKPTSIPSTGTPSKGTPDNEGEGETPGKGSDEGSDTPDEGSNEGSDESDNNSGTQSSSVAIPSPTSLVPSVGPSTVFSSVVKTITSCAEGIQCVHTSAPTPVLSAPSVSVPLIPSPSVPAPPVSTPSLSIPSPPSIPIPTSVASSISLPIPANSSLTGTSKLVIPSPAPPAISPTSNYIPGSAPSFSNITNNGTVQAPAKTTPKPTTVLVTSVVGSSPSKPNAPSVAPSAPISVNGGEKVGATWGLLGVVAGLVVLF